MKKKQDKKQNKSMKIPKTVQQSIPYFNVYPNGIIETEQGKFTKSYLLKDVNYQVANEKDQATMFVKYEDFLNSFDTNTDFQITINNRNIPNEQFEAEVLLPLQHDSLDIYRSEYNRMLKDKIKEGKNNIKRDKYITVSIESDSYETACTSFIRIDNEVKTGIKKIGGAEARELTIAERLEILYNLYNIGQEGTFSLNNSNTMEWFKKLGKDGLTTKDIIGPSSMKFRSDYIEIGDKFARTLYLKDLPSYLNDSILSEITNADCNMITSMNMNSLPQDEAVKLVRNQLRNIRSNLIDKQKDAFKKGFSADLVSPELMRSQEEANELLSDIQSKNQKLFLTTLVITIFADSLQELKDSTEKVMTSARKYVCNIHTLKYQQELGFNSSLPLCNNKIEIKRTLTTESAAVFIPFTSQELTHKKGTYFGLNAISKNLILLDRNKLKNGNGFIFGTPGSGKSFSAKRCITNTLLASNDDIIILDPENEYGPLVDLLGGEKISIEVGGKHYINPLDMDENYSGEDNKDPIILKSDFMISLCETVIGGRYGLTSVQRSIIDRCTRMVFKDYQASGKRIDDRMVYDQSKLPTLLDFQKILASQPEREAREVALALELYTSGSLDNFSKHTNVDTNNRLISYNIRDIGSGLQTMAMLVLLDSIWNRILSNFRKGKKTWVFIDEAHLLVANDTAATYLKTLYKRSRKYFGMMTCITQNVEDFLLSDITRTMISNSEFTLLLNQAQLDRQELAVLLNISETQLSYITAAEPGEGLLIAEQSKNIIPFKDVFPTDTKLYKVMTTKPSEIAQYKLEAEQEQRMKNKTTVNLNKNDSIDFIEDTIIDFDE